MLVQFGMSLLYPTVGPTYLHPTVETCKNYSLQLYHVGIQLDHLLRLAQTRPRYPSQGAVNQFSGELLHTEEAKSTDAIAHHQIPEIF